MKREPQPSARRVTGETGTPRTTRGKLDDLNNGRDSLVNSFNVSDEDRVAASLVITSAALADGEDPLTVSYERRVELRQVLASLGLLELSPTVIIKRDALGREVRRVTPVASAPAACREYAGTGRGYNRHLTSYETPCDACLDWRRRDQAERWEGLGLEHGTYVRMEQ